MRGENQMNSEHVSQGKLKKISQNAKWTAIALGVIPFFFQQFILNSESVKKLYAPIQNSMQPGTASLTDYITLGNTVIASAPLIIAFAGCYVFYRRKQEKGEGLAPGHFYAGAFLLYLSALMGNLVGFTPVKTSIYRLLMAGNPYSTFSLMMSDYHSSYGSILFLSSLIVGLFVGSSWMILSDDHS
jgi:hypothetical protein